ncbi:hypothetical protein OG897_33685 [Streptomyces sp. NBC_00237]|uniref:hypothetical protein n=1 Tax=Streptomyces sp. NBC_00237 TaxID=2975687 RepID=UPI002259EED9|nr:hypothetical protein [Streptomyces sp. NBC_00237]MCX5206346.1 hypothetical protein [Streptomyces sp. NBC_00237]
MLPPRWLSAAPGREPECEDEGRAAVLHPTTGDPNARPRPGAPPQRPAPILLTVPRARRGALWWLGWLVPVIAAHRLCSPTREGRVEDPVIKKAHLWRLALGLGLTVGAWLAFGLVPLREMPGRFFESFGWGLSAVQMNVYVAGVAVAMTPAGRKGAAAARWRGPFLAFAVTLTVFILQPIDLSHWPPSWSWTTVFGGWMLLFGGYGGLLLVLNGGRTADVNDALPAVVPFFTVLAVVLPSIGDPMYDQVSMPTRLVLGLTGPLTLVLLTGWELRRLRTLHGVRLSDMWRRG